MLVADDVGRARDDRPPRCGHRGEVDEPVVASSSSSSSSSSSPRTGPGARGSTRCRGSGRTRSARRAGRGRRSPRAGTPARSPRSRPRPRSRAAAPRTGAGRPRRARTDRRPRPSGRRAPRPAAPIRSLAGSTLVSTRTTTGAADRRIPALSAAAWPRRVAGPHDLDRDPRAPRARRRRAPARAAAWSSDGPLATTTTWVPSGERSASAADGTREVRGPVRRHEHDRRDARPAPRPAATAPTRWRRSATIPSASTIRRRGPLEGVQRGRVDDLPAGRLDLRAQRVGGRPVPGRGGRRRARRRARGSRGAPRHRPSPPRIPAAGRRTRGAVRRAVAQLPPSGLISAFLPPNAKKMQVGHLEGRVVATQGRMKRRVAHDREPAALDRPVEGLGDDPGADAVEPPVVQLRLAQDVEPQRRVGGHARPSRPP